MISAPRSAEGPEQPEASAAQKKKRNKAIRKRAAAVRAGSEEQQQHHSSAAFPTGWPSEAQGVPINSNGTGTCSVVYLSCRVIYSTIKTLASVWTPEGESGTRQSFHHTSLTAEQVFRPTEHVLGIMQWLISAQ